MRPARRPHAAVTIAVAATVALAGLAGPAAAEEQDWGVVELGGANLRVNTGACMYVPISVTYRNQPGVSHDWSADVEVWRGPQYVDSAFVWDEATTDSDAATVTMTDRYLWCGFEGLGTFRIGPSEVEVSNYDGGPDASFRDDTRGTFTVKQDARVSLAAARATPRRMVELTSVSTYFNDNRSRWVRWSEKNVRFQRATASGWVTLERVRTNRNGVAVVTVPAREEATFRAVTAADDRTWDARSPERTVPAA